jgi:hypothetical protein
MLKGFVIRKAYKLGGACSMYGDSRGVCMVLVGKPVVKRSLGRPRIRWEDNMCQIKKTTNKKLYTVLS